MRVSIGKRDFDLQGLAAASVQRVLALEGRYCFVKTIFGRICYIQRMAAALTAPRSVGFGSVN